jgi:hypothetical protein
MDCGRSRTTTVKFPVRGVDYWLTDDHDSYNDILPDRVKSLVHTLRTRARRRERVSELHEAGELGKLREYLEDEYETAYEKLGGNTQRKLSSVLGRRGGGVHRAGEYERDRGRQLAVEIRAWRSVRAVPWGARTSLLALRDSILTFANGEPAESFAQMLGESSLQTLPPRENEQVAQAAA